MSWKDSEALFEELLYDEEFIFVGHNIAYDFAVLAAQYPRFLRQIFEVYKNGRVRDTMIRQKLLDISIGRFRGYRVPRSEKEMEKAGKNAKEYRWIKVTYSLDDCYHRATKKRLDKDTWRKRYSELRMIELQKWPDGAKKYAEDDAVATWDVFWWQERMNEEIKRRFGGIRTHLIDPDPLCDEQSQCRAAWWMQLMKTWGIKTHPENVYKLTDIIDESYNELEELLKQPIISIKNAKGVTEKVGLVKPDGVRNIKAARAYMMQVMKGKENCRLTDTGEVSLDIEACEVSGNDILMDYAALGSLKSIKSKDIPMLAKGGAMPIHSNFDSLVATGRSSSAKPNVQNPRRLAGIRECFIPRKGKVFLDADYDGLELRTLAQVCLKLVGQSKLADVLNSGKDPHLQVAAQLLGISYQAAEIRAAKGDDEVDDARQLGKIANFGFPGGLGFDTLIYFARKQFGRILSEHDARKLKAHWLRAYPEMEKYFGLIDKYCSEDIENNTAFIQHLFSRRIRGGINYTVACNSNFQGLGADATKAAGFLIAWACYIDESSPLYGCRIVNYIHDQFILECDEDRAHEAALELARLMEVGAAPYLPDVPPKVSKPLVARKWSKKAKQVWKDGRLIPWDMEFTVASRDKREKKTAA